jgi:hypothetical protein
MCSSLHLTADTFMSQFRSVNNKSEIQVLKSTHNLTIHHISYTFRLKFCIHHQADPKNCIITFHILGVSLMKATKE